MPLNRRLRFPAAFRAAAMFMAFALAGGMALAQDAQAPARAASAPAAAASQATKQLERVEVTGSRADEMQERRQSTAAKIVVGRDEIERYGDSSVGDLLKRLPGVTMQGRPGRGGNIRMRGLGNGYTQILLDGERVPPGFSIDSLSPEQIERIEILRAPTAETGARAIAGTINIITREGFRKSLNDLKLTAGFENDRLQPALAWTRNDSAGALSYNGSVSAFRNDRRSDSVTSTERRDLATDAVTLLQTDTGIVREKRDGLHATGRLQWRSEGVGTITLMPLLIYGTGSTARDGRLVQDVGADPVPYDSAHTDSSGSFSLARLNGNWTVPLADGGRFEWRGGMGQSRSRSTSLRQETTAGTLSRTLTDDADTVDRNLSVNAKLSLTLGEDHSVVTGIEAEANRRSDTRHTLQDGAPLLTDFGDDLQARATRFAAYAQDEWNLTPQWALHAGLRWEGIETRGSGAAGDAQPHNRSSVWTPLFHAVWKPEPKSRDQVRLSLTRSYRSPSLGNLIARPSINTRFPAPGANTPTQPDRAGNPALAPELATGLDVAFEHYLPAGGLFSANVFHRRIRQYMRNQVTLETVSWADVPRWVSRPQNIGDAMTQGIELEAKFRLSDLAPNAPRIDLRSNLSFFRSRVNSVGGPDNRLDQQPSATANLGADWRVGGTPLTVGGNLNWTPAYTTRLADVQTAYQGRKLVTDAYALWVFGPTVQLRVTASNLDPRDYVTGGALDADGVRETSTTVAPTSLNLQLRLELKL